MPSTNVKYDVFISYRRTGGAAEARLIQTKLMQRGLRAFLDVDDLRAGDFNRALLDRIAEAPNFVVILSSDSLKRCADEGDWLRLELEQAVKTGRNIVPILMPGFQFPKPDTLPESLSSLHTYQSVNYSHDFFTASIDKLVGYLQPRAFGSSWLHPLLFAVNKPKSALFIALAAIAAAVIALALLARTRIWRPAPIVQHGHWETFDPLPTARSQLMAASVGTMLCVIGGVGPQGDVPTLEVNNIGTNEGWVAMPQLPKPDASLDRHDLSMILDTQPPDINTWHTGRYQASVGVIGGKLYVVGGWRTIPPYPSSLLQIYDPFTHKWSAGAPMPIMSGCSSAGVIDGRWLYVLTPCDGHPGYFNFLHVYDAVTNTWAVKDSAPHQHGTAAAGVIEGKLYVVGGNDGSNGFSAALDVFNPATGTWTTKAAMPTARAALAGGVINGKLYAVGGMNEKGASSALEVYDPATDTWTTESPMPTPRSGIACAVVNGRLYVVGGSDDKNRVASTVEVYVPAAARAPAR
jgi:hypothetical protein